MNQIQVTVSRQESNDCPTRDDFRTLCTDRIIQVAKEQGIMAKDATSWPCRVEFILRPSLKNGYEVTAEFHQ